MPRYKNLNGVRVQLTAEEEATRDTEEKIWSDAKSIRQLAEIRRIRNEKLSETDYLAMSDNTMSEEMKTYRQSMRDIPQDYTTEDEYDLLLARDEQGNLTHTVWSKP
jgi:enterochelin esterase-like enzyme